MQQSVYSRGGSRLLVAVSVALLCATLTCVSENTGIYSLPFGFRDLRRATRSDHLSVYRVRHFLAAVLLYYYDTGQTDATTSRATTPSIVVPVPNVFQVQFPNNQAAPHRVC